MIRERTKWVAWLGETSARLKNADALLLPFITHALERRYVDRGLRVAERGLGVALLLVDTNTGELLWSGGRSAVVPAKRLEAAGVAGELAPPDWARVEERVYTDDLWRDFPGRQTY